MVLCGQGHTEQSEFSLASIMTFERNNKNLKKGDENVGCRDDYRRNEEDTVI